MGCLVVVSADTEVVTLFTVELGAEQVVKCATPPVKEGALGRGNPGPRPWLALAPSHVGFGTALGGV